MARRDELGTTSQCLEMDVCVPLGLGRTHFQLRRCDCVWWDIRPDDRIAGV